MVIWFLAWAWNYEPPLSHKWPGEEFPQLRSHTRLEPMVLGLWWLRGSLEISREPSLRSSGGLVGGMWWLLVAIMIYSGLLVYGSFPHSLPSTSEYLGMSENNVHSQNGNATGTMINQIIPDVRQTYIDEHPQNGETYYTTYLPYYHRNGNIPSQVGMYRTRSLQVGP